MSQLTEAQCLIEQGAMFPYRQGFRDVETGGTILIGFKTGACSIYFDDAPIYHFDLEGRWQRAFVGADTSAPDTPKNLAGVPGTHYLKALDTSTTALVRLREGHEIKIRRRRLGFAETVQFDDHVRKVAMSLYEGIASGRLKPVDPPSEGRAAGTPPDLGELLSFFDRVAGWDTATWTRQKENFMATYGPQPMSPPVCPGPVVLQATLGDSGEHGIGFGGCRTTPLYVRSKEEFERHAGRVVALWGRRLAQARGIHMAGSDLITRPMPEVIDAMETAARMFGEVTVDVTHRVIDPPRSLRKTDMHMMTHHLERTPPTPEMFREYRQRGLVHLTIGVESVSGDVLRAYGRSWRLDDLQCWLTNAAEADLPVSVVWIVGAGGTSLPEDVGHAAKRIEEIAWCPGTIVYLLDAGEIAEGAIRGQLGIRESNAAELNELRRLTVEPARARGVKVLPYTIDKEWQ